MIAAGGPFNNMSHLVKTERISDFLLWYSSTEVFANDWGTPSNSVLKSFYERVNRKPIDDLSLVSTVSGYANLISGSFWFFSYLLGTLKTFFLCLRSIDISHLMSRNFQRSLNWDSPSMSIVFSTLWTHSG